MQTNRKHSCIKLCKITSTMLQFVLVTLLLTVSTSSKPACAQTGKSSNWCVLIHVMKSPEDPLTLSLGDEERTVWATITSNGRTTKTLNGLVGNIAGRLSNIQIKTIEDKLYCKRHDFTFGYEVDQLVVKPVNGGKSRVLLGQSQLREAQAELAAFRVKCKGKEPMFDMPGQNEKQSQTIINPLSLVANYLSVEYRSNLFPGGAHPLHDTEWRSYLLNARGVAIPKKNLPREIIRKAEKEFENLPSDEQSTFDPDFSQFAIVPSAHAVAIQFGLPHSVEYARGAVGSLTVQQPKGLDGKYERMRRAFVLKHPRFIPWKRATVYTLAPNSSAVVYCLNNRLYWKALGGKAKMLCSAKNIRGWQWYISKR